MDLSNRHIAVTGASSGIGLATATLLAAHGASVSLIARRQEALNDAVARIHEGGGAAVALGADVSDKAKLTSALDAAAAMLGPIDGLFANAGTGGAFGPFVDYEDETFETVLRTNLYSAFWAMKHVLPGMIERQRGSILVTGSIASERGMGFNPGYVASKHAVLGLARAAAVEVALHNVRVNCIIPGFIVTPMLEQLPPDAHARMAARVPQGRTGSAEEVAQAAAFLLSDEASHITAQCWAVDGGVLNTVTV